MRGRPVDDLEVHALLLERSDRLGRVKVHQRDLAVELGLSHFTVCRVISRLESEGLLRRLRSLERNVGIYAVRPKER